MQAEHVEDEKEYFVRQCSFVCDYPFDEISKYAITCRVWGLLKYYHPNVTAGKFDWDSVLFDCLDSIKTASSAENTNTAIRKMILAAGKYKLSKKDNFNDSLSMNMNLCWIDNSFLDKGIRQTLREISSITVAQPSYYNPEREEGKPFVYRNEKNYEIHDLLYDSKYRLLTLFRYWNVIYYFSPYKYLMDKSWDIVLSESVPKFISASDISSYDRAIIDMAVDVNDGHAFTSVTPSVNDLTEYFTLIDSNTVVNIPPKPCQLEKGDIILKIGNRDIRNIRDSIAVFISSSNVRYTNYMIDKHLYTLMQNNSAITIRRNNKTLNVPVEFIPPVRKKTEPLPSFEKISNEIAYIRLNELKKDEIPGMFDSLTHTKGIIMDLRNYPRNSFFNDVICHLSTKREHEYLQFTYADLAHPGAFYWSEKNMWPSYTEEQIASSRKYKGKVVVLISEITFSAAETAAVMYRTAGNAILIGRPSAGSNGDLAQLLLPNKVFVYFSGLGAYYPDRTGTQRKGVIPDIEVYPDMQSILNGKDEILERAISYINDL
jgi:hypothetical protein